VFVKCALGMVGSPTRVKKSVKAHCFTALLFQELFPRMSPRFSPSAMLFRGPRGSHRGDLGMPCGDIDPVEPLQETVPPLPPKQISYSCVEAPPQVFAGKRTFAQMHHDFVSASGPGCALADSQHDAIKDAVEALMILKQSPEAMTSQPAVLEASHFPHEEGWGPWDRHPRPFHRPATIQQTGADCMKADDWIADAEALASVTSTISPSSECSTGNPSHNALDSDIPIPPIRQIHTRRRNEAAGEQGQSKNKNCHFCEHAPKRTSLFSCLRPTCNQIFCENCCVRHLGKPINFKSQADADAIAWCCPLCTR